MPCFEIIALVSSDHACELTVNKETYYPFSEVTFPVVQLNGRLEDWLSGDRKETETINRYLLKAYKKIIYFTTESPELKFVKVFSFEHSDKLTPLYDSYNGEINVGSLYPNKIVSFTSSSIGYNDMLEISEGKYPNLRWLEVYDSNDIKFIDSLPENIETLEINVSPDLECSKPINFKGEIVLKRAGKLDFVETPNITKFYYSSKLLKDIVSNFDYSTVKSVVVNIFFYRQKMRLR